jgi:hypothetical protein
MHIAHTSEGSIFPVHELLFPISKNRLIVLVFYTFGKNNDLGIYDIIKKYKW